MVVQKGCELFSVMSEVRMNSGTASSARLQDLGMITPPGIMQTLRFPGFAVFHQRVQHFRELHGACVRVTGIAALALPHMRSPNLLTYTVAC